MLFGHVAMCSGCLDCILQIVICLMCFVSLFHRRVSFRRKKKEEKGVAAPVKEEKVSRAQRREPLCCCHLAFLTALNNCFLHLF